MVLKLQCWLVALCAATKSRSERCRGGDRCQSSWQLVPVLEYAGGKGMSEGWMGCCFLVEALGASGSGVAGLDVH